MMRASRSLAGIFVLSFNVGTVAQFAPQMVGGNVWGTQAAPEGCPTSWYVEVWGTPPFNYQWFRDGTPIPGATSDWFIIWNTTVADSGTTYQVLVSNAYGSMESDIARLEVWNDFVAPRIVSAQAGDDLDEVELSFYNGVCGGRPLDPVSASDVSNYAISGGVHVLSAQVLPTGTNVLLKTARQRPHMTYVVVVANVADHLGNQLREDTAQFESAFSRGVFHRRRLPRK